MPLYELKITFYQLNVIEMITENMLSENILHVNDSSPIYFVLNQINE